MNRTKQSLPFPKFNDKLKSLNSTQLKKEEAVQHTNLKATLIPNYPSITPEQLNVIYKYGQVKFWQGVRWANEQQFKNNLTK